MYGSVDTGLDVLRSLVRALWRFLTNSGSAALTPSAGVSALFGITFLKVLFHKDVVGTFGFRIGARVRKILRNSRSPGFTIFVQMEKTELNRRFHD